MRANTIEDFFRKIDVGNSPAGCWEWTGSTNEAGYARFKMAGKMFIAHRFIYQNLIAAIPETLVIDHLCRNRRCVNPLHLEVVTSRENILRGIGVAAVNSQTTHCPKGHEYTGESTHYYKGGRVCRACDALRKRKNLAINHPDHPIRISRKY